jgi:hypothetical protein
MVKRLGSILVIRKNWSTLLAVLGVDPTVLMASVPDGVVEVVTSDAMQETMQDFIARVSGG